MTKVLRKKYSLAVYFSIISPIALFYDKIDGSEFMILVGGILAIFNHYDVKEKQSV